MTLPPLHVQQAVADILGPIDDLIENNRRRIEVLEEMAQAVYREWFVHFRYPGHENATFVDSPLGPIPEGWKVQSLDEVASVSRGLSWNRDRESVTGTPVLTIPNIGRDLDTTGATRLEQITPKEREKFHVEEGDLLVIGSNGNPARVGQSVWVPAGLDALYASFLMRVRASTAIPKVLLWLHVTSDQLMDRLRAGAVGSTGLRNLRVTAFREAQIVRATIDIERQFEADVLPLRNLRDTLLATNTRLRGLRDQLLPKLVTGEIDVSELDFDGLVEVAS